MDKLLEEQLAQRISKEGSFIDKRGRELGGIKQTLKLPDEGKLYYPACGGDYSPSVAFPDWEIYYMDPVVFPGDFKVKSGKERFIKGDLTIQPFDKNLSFDVVMLVSPGAHLEPGEAILKATQNLKEGGLLICDNWHGTKDRVQRRMQESFEEVKLDKVGELSVFRKIAQGA